MADGEFTKFGFISQQTETTSSTVGFLLTPGGNYDLQNKDIENVCNITIDAGCALFTDTINETTADNGVSIDGVVLKDSDVDADIVEAQTRVETNHLQELSGGTVYMTDSAITTPSTYANPSVAPFKFVADGTSTVVQLENGTPGNSSSIAFQTNDKAGGFLNLNTGLVGFDNNTGQMALQTSDGANFMRVELESTPAVSFKPDGTEAVLIDSNGLEVVDVLKTDYIRERNIGAGVNILGSTVNTANLPSPSTYDNLVISDNADNVGAQILVKNVAGGLAAWSMGYYDYVAGGGTYNLRGQLAYSPPNATFGEGITLSLDGTQINMTTSAISLSDTVRLTDIPATDVTNTALLLWNSTSKNIETRDVSTLPGGNPFDQMLNSTDSVEFAGITLNSDTVYLGNNAGQNVSTGLRNIAVGLDALGLGVTTGSDNIAIGNQALQDNISGSDNIAIGDGSMANRISGSDNIGIGENALQNSSGNNNIAIGQSTGDTLNFTGSGNVLVGLQAGTGLTLGSDSNVFIGDRAGSSHTGGDYNMFLGYFCSGTTNSTSNEFAVKGQTNYLMRGSFATQLLELQGGLNIETVANNESEDKLLSWDSTNKDVSYRDVPGLLTKHMGEIYISNNATTTTISATGTFYTISGTWTDSALSSSTFGLTSSVRLTYTGQTNLTFHMGATTTLDLVSGNAECTIQAFKNGVAVPSGRAQMQVSSGQPASTAIHWFSSLSTNDYVDVRIANETGTANITCIDANVFGLAMETV